MDKDENLTMIVKRILALAFLPAPMIEEEYERQKQEIADDGEYYELLDRFFEYFESYWMRIITPEGFSVFGLSKRSNNVVEGFNFSLQYALSARPMPCDYLCNYKKSIVISILYYNEVLSNI